MQNAKLWQRLLGVEATVVESMFVDEAGAMVASLRTWKGPARLCCGPQGRHDHRRR